MKLNFAWVLEGLYPSSADEKLIRNSTAVHFVSKLLIQQHASDVYTLASFRDPQIRAALHLVKFHNHTHGAKLLGALLSSYLASLPQRTYTIIPVPLSRQRQSKRGHNQVETITRYALKNLPHIHLQTGALIKVRHTESQTSLSREERIHNLTDAFVLKKRYVEHLKNKHIILIDDVITTGTTIANAKAALSPIGAASIISLGLAH